MNNLTVKQRLEQFDLKHGWNDAVKSLDNAYWLFPDGARRETNPYGLLQEPPSPESCCGLVPGLSPDQAVDLELLKRLREYHTARLTRLIRDFQHRKQQMLLGHYSEEDLKELQVLQKAVRACQHELNMIEDKILPLCPMQRFRESQAHAEQQRQQRAAIINGINI